MSSPDQPAAPEGAPPERRWLALLRAFVNGSAFEPALLLVPAIAAGVLLAPQLATRTYPTNPEQLGTPALGNIKAPHDIDVVDEEMTQRLRDEAVGQVRRVYDYDVALADKIATGVEAAFALGQQRLASPDDPAAATLVPEVERLLGTPLKPDEAQALATLKYPPEMGVAIARAVRESLAQPVVGARAALEPDRQKGITIQRVPDQGGPTRAVDDVDQLQDIDATRRELPQRVRRQFSDLTPQARDLVIAIGGRLLEPNLTFNRAATELAREVSRLSVSPVSIAVKKGEMILRDGERLTRRHLLIFEALSQAHGGGSLLVIALGAGLAVLVLVAAALYGSRGRMSLQLSRRDLGFLVAAFVTLLAAARGWIAVASILHEHFPTWPQGLWLMVMPIAAGAMIVRLVLRVEVGAAFAVVTALVVGLMVEGDRLYALYAVVGSLLGATLIGTISARGDLVRVGWKVGVGQVAAALAVLLFGGTTDFVAYLVVLPAALVGGVLTGLVSLALTPVVEAVFGYSTDLKLLELANLNHPALKELIVQAPGSYHHSVIVGSLVEAAAEAIGANPLLARVMAYYHDLGKGCNPGYFIENQRAGQNPHDDLKPSLSAMIIRRHVTDGLDLARKHRLGEAIMAGIAEHHGTTLIHFFYHKAKEQEGEHDPVSDSDYRYPGQKPQSREAALVMLGDSVEAASRSLAEPTPARLQGLVQRIVNIKFTDGQLEECDLTLKDLHHIAKAFSRVLGSIYHSRPEYPELLSDLGDKKHGDSDPKQQKKPKGDDKPPEDNRPDNLRRLGLS